MQPENEYSDCEFSFAINRFMGTISVICEKHKTGKELLSDICVKRLLDVLEDYNSPFSSMTLRASRRDASHIKLEQTKREE